MEFFIGSLWLSVFAVSAPVVLEVDIGMVTVVAVAVATAMAVAAAMAAVTVVVDTERPQMKDIISYLKKAHELK